MVDIGFRLVLYNYTYHYHKECGMKKIVSVLLLSTASTMLWASSGAEIAEKYGCMGCHNLVGKGTGPAFRGVANRNLRRNQAGAKSSIIRSIQKGSKGKYPAFTAEMPPYASLSDTELDTLVDWILSQAVRRGQGRGRGHGRGGGRGMH